MLRVFYRNEIIEPVFLYDSPPLVPLREKRSVERLRKGRSCFSLWGGFLLADMRLDERDFRNCRHYVVIEEHQKKKKIRILYSKRAILYSFI